jgi:hypothetical protein
MADSTVACPRWFRSSGPTRVDTVDKGTGRGDERPSVEWPWPGACRERAGSARNDSYL